MIIIVTTFIFVLICVNAFGFYFVSLIITYIIKEKGKLFSTNPSLCTYAGDNTKILYVSFNFTIARYKSKWRHSNIKGKFKIFGDVKPANFYHFDWF